MWTVRKPPGEGLKRHIAFPVPGEEGYTFQGTEYVLDSDQDYFESSQSHLVSLGFIMDLSIPQPGTLAKYKKQKVELEKERLTANNKLEDYWTDFNVLYNNLETEKSVINLVDKKITLSEKILNTELKRYNQGHSSLNDLILVYNTIDSNRLSKITHIIKFYKNYLEWLRLTDSLVSNKKEINLNNE
jgi:outer membrane protein TolC